MQTIPRLYDTFQPQHYDVTIYLENADKRKFNGIVAVTGTSLIDGQMQLHAKDLNEYTATIDTNQVSTTLEGDTLTINSSDIKANQPVTVSLAYNGTITDPMHGLYPCYFEHNGVKKELYATQLESHHAREVFPCVDEPEAKATYKLTLVTKSGITALGNMPVEQQQEENGLLTTTFELTPIMSSYLLAFVVGEIHKKTATTKSGVEVNIWATPVQTPESLDFALDSATRAIEFFDDYFGVPYPLPKADHVALPDFSSGAMENWGLITYREICLLVDENTSISTRQYVSSVIAHETSHQWFGNLVTMKWWDDLWLNESFATLMSYMCVDAMFPSWNIWMMFATSETMSATRRDYLPTIQPVKTTVNHPDEISTLFDPSIVYAKGARLLAMLHHYVGDEAFRTGLAYYFMQHAYANTTGNDLWEALGTTSHLDIAGFMNPWLEQPGFPVVTIDKTSLTQERFVLGGENPTPGAVWPIPLAANQPSIPALFSDKTASINVTNDDTALNQGGRGHFITHYGDQDMLATRIAAIANGSEADPIDRLIFLHDASLLARAGKISAVNLLDLTSAYQNEFDEPVWDIISLIIADLKRFIETSDIHEKKFKQRVIQLAKQCYERLGWDDKPNDTESDVKLRATIIGLLSYADDEAIIEHGLKDFRTVIDPAFLPGEIRSVIFSMVVKHGREDEINALISLHTHTSNPELRSDIASALCSTRDTLLIERLLKLLKDDTVIRLQDVDHWFVYLIRNRFAREATWQWLINEWTWIEQVFGSDKSYDNFVRYSASAFSTREWLARFTDFFGPKKSIPALTRAIELGQSDIQARATWLERDQAAFLAKL